MCALGEIEEWDGAAVEHSVCSFPAVDFIVLEVERKRLEGCQKHIILLMKVDVCQNA